MAMAPNKKKILNSFSDTQMYIYIYVEVESKKKNKQIKILEKIVSSNRLKIQRKRTSKYTLRLAAFEN